MPVPSLHEFSRGRAQLRSFILKMGKPYNYMPTRTGLAALANHGGLYTMLDTDLMTARMAAFSAARATADDKKATGKKPLTVEAAGNLRAMVKNFFYKLVDKEGYLIHSELMAYLSEPGKGNGVIYDEGAKASPSIPAAFTFVGQFIDHDLTLNAINLTDNEQNVVAQDNASPLIDLDSVYGVLLKDVFKDGKIDVNSKEYKGFKKVFKKIFHQDGRFKHNAVGTGFDLPREEDGMGGYAAVIFDPRNDENQLILQIHILIQRFHNKLIECGTLKTKIDALDDPTDPIQIVECVRREVVATWQSFVLNEYMPAIIRKEVLDEVIEQINIEATDPQHPEAQYGNLKHKPYKELITGKNVVRMPHEFAIGFRFGHSQLRPFYILNEKSVVILFKDARASQDILLNVKHPYDTISGKDDLRGNRNLNPAHVIDWNVFYPTAQTDETQSLRIDGKVTARVFNLPESAIPDDIKYIGNLAHRNLIRSSQIGIVSGEELARFYEITDILTPDEVLGKDAGRKAAEDLFKLDSYYEIEEPDSECEKIEMVIECEDIDAVSKCADPDPDCESGAKKEFKTPLWYYLLKEADVHSEKFCDNPIEINDKQVCRNQLGKVGSRLVAEVLAGALYYGSDFRIDKNWTSSAIQPAKPQKHGDIQFADSIKLRDIINFVNNGCPKKSVD